MLRRVLCGVKDSLSIPVDLAVFRFSVPNVICIEHCFSNCQGYLITSFLDFSSSFVTNDYLSLEFSATEAGVDTQSS